MIAIPFSALIKYEMRTKFPMEPLFYGGRSTLEMEWTVLFPSTEKKSMEIAGEVAAPSPSNWCGPWNIPNYKNIILMTMVGCIVILPSQDPSHLFQIIVVYY